MVASNGCEPAVFTITLHNISRQERDQHSSAEKWLTAAAECWITPFSEDVTVSYPLGHFCLGPGGENVTFNYLEQVTN